jgi:pyruvate-ferredoxin/flavodoxin oxidoreductase
MQAALDLGVDAPLAKLLADWIKNGDDAETSKKLHKEIVPILKETVKNTKGDVKKVLKSVEMQSDCIIKKSIWIIGGDGWAYDIGFGGLDHVIATGEDVNMLVVDTEVYSNTGGQASKATPTGSTAKFAYAGMRTKKKDLGMMAMSYGYVYVAQIGMGANMQQTVTAIAEAEAYKGPSVVIAYSTCIAHGIDMSAGQKITKDAVEAGYWSLYRYNPVLAAQGQNPFTLDSKDPTGSYTDFIKREARYTALSNTHPELATELFERAAKEAKERHDSYKFKAGK